MGEATGKPPRRQSLRTANSPLEILTEMKEIPSIRGVFGSGVGQFNKN